MRNGPDKNPFRGVSDLLSRAAPAKRSLHFLSYIIDLLLVFIVSYLLFLGGNAIVSNTSEYKKNQSLHEGEITYYQDMLVEAHIAEYLNRDEHTIASDEDLSIKMAISQILLSYSHDDPEFKEFNEDPSIKLKEVYVGSFYESAFVNADFDKDYIAQFIIDYVPNHNTNNELIDFKEKTPKDYFITYYQNHAVYYSNLKYAYPDGEFPYLKPEVAKEIYKYLVQEGDYSRDRYDDFVNLYSAMLDDSEELVFNAETYQKEHYSVFVSSRRKITQAVDTTMIVSIFLAYFIAVFLPMMIFRDGRSFGKIFLRLGVMNTDKSEVEVWKIILRSFLAALSNVFIAFFLVLLPPFNGSSMILYLPFIFDITMLHIILIIFILASINGIFMLLTHEKRSLTDIIFKTITVDVTLLDEPDYDEKNETNS